MRRLLLLSTLLGIFTFVNVFTNIKSYRWKLEKQQSIITLKNNEIRNLSNRLVLMSKNSHFKVNQIDFTGLDMKNNLFDNSKISKPKLVIRFSEMNCTSCIKTDYKLAKSFTNISNNLICAATYKRQIDLISNKRVIGITDTIINIPFNTFNNEMERKKIPYYFIIDGSNLAKHVFISDPNSPYLTKKYFEFINSYLSDSLHHTKF